MIYADCCIYVEYLGGIIGLRVRGFGVQCLGFATSRSSSPSPLEARNLWPPVPRV